MAKKKRRKRRPGPRPGGSAQATATATESRPESPSNRQLRKELARKERERALKRARRRVRTRRLMRWGAVVVVLAAIAGFFVYRNIQAGRQQELAAAAIGCGPIQTKQREVDETAAMDSVTRHSPPFAEGTNGVPVTAGAHSSTLPPEPHVYDNPVPEENAVHNLEHGYVLIYYRQDGEEALPDDFRAALEDLAQGESKVIMAPYEGLDGSLALVAWGKLQMCTVPAEGDTGDGVTVARWFIDQFRGGGLAPEPSGA
jgi:hypothetical protein